MVREILHVQVGQCGNQVGTKFWEAVTAEHSLSFGDGTWEEPADGKIQDEDGDGIPDEVENVSVYFRSTGAKQSMKEPWRSDKRTPRAILVDLEPGTLDVIKAGRLSGLFDPVNMVFGANGAGNNWAKGHYTEGAEIVEDVLDKIRKEAEKADCVQGFQLFHSLGGGTGSGMGTLLLLKIRDAYPDKITCTYSVFPSPKVSDTVVEPYNAVLSSHQLLENSDETFVIDNEALYNIMHNVLEQKTVEYSVLNELIARVACGVTASIRFPVHSKLSVKEFAAQAVSARNFYCNVKPDDGKVLAVSFMFRGRSVESKDVDSTMAAIQADDKHGLTFVEWIPNNIKSGICKVAGVVVGSKGNKTPVAMSATTIQNTTALKGIFQRLATQFGAMYRRKAFLHWYKGEGMDEMEFQEADKNVRDLITEYQDKEDAQYEDDSGEEDEEEES